MLCTHRGSLKLKYQTLDLFCFVFYKEAITKFTATNDFITHALKEETVMQHPKLLRCFCFH